MDRKRKADDPSDVTVQKKATSGDTMDCAKKVLDSCAATLRTLATPCDITEGGSGPSTSSAPTSYSVTGVSGGTVSNSNVAGVIVNYPAAECSLLQHLITETEMKIRSRDPTNVSTYTERAAFRHLKTCGSIIIKGRSGSGKSHLGYTLLERVAKSCSRIPVKVSSPKEWNYIHKSRTSDAKKYVVMVDDIFGRTNLIQSSLDEWRQKFDLVWPLVESGQIWLVMTSRPEIISQGEPEIFRYEVINKAKQIVLDEGKYRLRESEKLQFLEILCGKDVRKEDMKEIANMDTTLGFPQCCTFFAANKDARLKGVEFFKKPFEFIKDLFECVKKAQPEVYFVLLLVFMNEGRLSMKELMSIEHEDKFERQFKTISSHCRLKKTCLSKADIRDVAKSVCGIYLSEASRCFLFSHRSIHDVLFVALCEDSLALGIRMSTPVMLLEFIRINKQKLERCKQRNVVFLDEEDYPILADKLREYLSNEKTRYVVLSHPALQDTEFLRVIFREWKTDDIYQLCRHNGEKVVKLFALPLSGKLGLPQTVNILEYNLFLSYVIMNHMKEFASRKIQLLRSCNSEDIHPVLNEALLCALFTCDKDLATALLSSGAKPNMLCFISLCNWPQLDANTSSTIISQIEDNETNLKLLLSIAVISCNKTVIRVLSPKLTALSGDHDQFYSHCLELLLKINGNGHRGITQMTTNAGHDILEVMTLLEEGGGQLDSRKISLASSHKDPSVLRKLLLRSCDDIHVTDEFGRTPLHLACMYGGADGVELLLEHGAELSVDKRGSTPFHFALKSCVDQKKKLKLLLKKNSTNDEDFVNLTDHVKRRALHYAAGAEAQADIPGPFDMFFVHQQKWHVQIRLCCAAKNECMECVKLLLPESNVNAQDSDGNTALHFSSLSDEPHSHEVIQALLEKGADVRIKNKKGETPLHCAARKKCMECVELLLPLLSVNAQDGDGNTPLLCNFLSAKPHSHKVLQALLKNGADAGIKNKKGETPLHCAAREKCMECVESLLPDSDVNAQDVDGNTPLLCNFLSAKRHSHKVIQALLKKGADVRIKSKKGETPLHCVARKKCMECVELLVRLSDVNAQDSDGDTPLLCNFLSAKPHSYKVLQALLEKGADVRIKNKKGQTPLHCAARNKCMECVELLVRLSDVNAQDSDGDTPLLCNFLSAKPHSHKVLQALLEKGADVRIKNKKGQTPLHCAARNKCMECVELLVPLSDVNAQDSDGDTPLLCNFLSAKPHSHKVLQALLEKGADVRIKNKKGQTPLHCAARNKCMECVELLVRLSDVNAQDSDGDTPLLCNFLSAKPHSHKVLQALLENGADAGIKNKKDETPLHCAAREKCIEGVKLLVPLLSVNVQDGDGNTPLLCVFHDPFSSEFDCFDECLFHEVLQALLKEGADVQMQNRKGQTPLHYVNAQDVDGNTPFHCVFHDPFNSEFDCFDECLFHEVLQALLKNVDAPGIKNKKGETPLHYAARAGYMECVELLVPLSDVNAQIVMVIHLYTTVSCLMNPTVMKCYKHCWRRELKIKNKKGETPLHCAAREKCIEGVKLLVPLLSVNVQDGDGNTPLHCVFHDPFSSEFGCFDECHSHKVLQALLENGADFKIKNKIGETPLHCAARKKCIECVELLLQVRCKCPG
ncbi:serine/threonine-protein phosphatase 6 regulatory ankyrin repeat subunit A-like [Haliotis rubra]|uniref:serine/threonine-protein phosphatase 6 regulatory ankyrin repeat subunit A-like n=1 Tax=Haliotis rubra TaxID=36100 RepID=UPI001EE5DD12|nr:serine/threonine-protein phosphatase 6 regulatory ankyrin repeat subunit A-like [Haliotis rubra]